MAAAIAVAASACGSDPTGVETRYPQRFAAVAAGMEHTCAVSLDGDAFCWGYPGLGRLGHHGLDRGCDERGCRVPVPMREQLPFTALAAGDAHSCGLVDSAAFCWGFNRFGQLGEDSTVVRNCHEDTPFRCSYDPVPLAIGAPLARIVAARTHGCALTDDGRALCWGWNIAGQLGRGDKDLAGHALPKPVDSDRRFADIATGYGGTCALTPAGAAYCWGFGESGQLGTGDTAERLSPTPVAGSLTFTRIAVGGAHTCGVSVSGEVFCWGRGSAGRLGTGDETDRLLPTAVPMPEEAVEVFAGHTHTCAIGVTGSLYCWGANDTGQLGVGDRENRLSPVEVALPGAAQQVSAGRWHTCAITDDHRLYCWGSNSRRQLGDGSEHGRQIPTLVNP